MLAKKVDTRDENKIKQALLACTGEFAGAIKNTELRAVFIADLTAKIGIDATKEEKQTEPLIALTEDVFITREKSYLVDAILQDFEIRFQALLDRAKKRQQPTVVPMSMFVQSQQTASVVALKQAIILEGDPGIGKSIFKRAMVAKYKSNLEIRRRKITSDPAYPNAEHVLELEVIDQEIKRPVYEISVDSADAVTVLKKAVDEEAFLLGDEANLNPDPALYELLNQYLSGVDDNKNR